MQATTKELSPTTVEWKAQNRAMLTHVDLRFELSGRLTISEIGRCDLEITISSNAESNRSLVYNNGLVGPIRNWLRPQLEAEGLDLNPDTDIGRPNGYVYTRLVSVIRGEKTKFPATFKFTLWKTSAPQVGTVAPTDIAQKDSKEMYFTLTKLVDHSTPSNAVAAAVYDFTIGDTLTKNGVEFSNLLTHLDEVIGDFISTLPSELLIQSSEKDHLAATQRLVESIVEEAENQQQFQIVLELERSINSDLFCVGASVGGGDQIALAYGNIDPMPSQSVPATIQTATHFALFKNGPSMIIQLSGGKMPIGHYLPIIELDWVLAATLKDYVQTEAPGVVFVATDSERDEFNAFKGRVLHVLESETSVAVELKIVPNKRGSVDLVATVMGQPFAPLQGDHRPHRSTHFDAPDQGSAVKRSTASSRTQAWGSTFKPVRDVQRSAVDIDVKIRNGQIKSVSIAVAGLAIDVSSIGNAGEMLEFKATSQRYARLNGDTFSALFVDLEKYLDVKDSFTEMLHNGIEGMVDMAHNGTICSHWFATIDGRVIFDN